MGWMSRLPKFLPFVLYPVLGLLVGWMSVEVDKGSGNGGGDSTVGDPTRWKRSQREAPPTRDEMVAVARRLVGTLASTADTAISAHIDDWTDAEILTALDEALKDPETTLSYNSMAAMLLREYVKRSPEGALEWLTRQTPMYQVHFVEGILDSFPLEKTDAALAFVKAHPALFGRNLPPNLVFRSITAASTKGPQGVVAALRSMMNYGVSRSYSTPVDFPAGFDFAGLLDDPEFKSMNLRMMRESIMREWGKEDREGACQWSMERKGAGGLMDIVRPFGASPDDIRWAMGKVDSFSPQQRDDFLNRASHQLAAPSGNAVAWIGASQSPEVRDAIRSVCTRIMLTGSANYVGNGLKVLETLPDPEARIAALDELGMDGKKPFGRGRLEIRSEELIRERLAGWGADAERADAIISRLQERMTPSGP
jgi:hypothetical protein